MRRILAVIGARPQFIKHAPLELALKHHFELRTLHTGQHYDENMSNIFFNELGLSEPAYQLNVGSAGHGVQTGLMMQEIEPIFMDFKPDAILVYGDTNSTLAGALVASKLQIPIVHVEAGLRSFNREMPEEINRVLTDHISELLIVPTQGAVENLHTEGIMSNVYLTGDVMKDMVLLAGDLAFEKRNDLPEDYFYATIHRPYNTDIGERLRYILDTLNQVGTPVIFSLHPRTGNIAKKEGIDLSSFHNIEFVAPLGYFDNISLLKRARCLITDSGGMQKEAYILKTPCLTIRKETEWTETLTGNWNRLLFDDLSLIDTQLAPDQSEYDPLLYGDGHAAKEITNIILKHFA